MISQKTIEEVKRRTSLIELVGESIALRRQGANYLGLCPFHAEKTPSFTVKGEGSFYYCFGCGASGTPIRFVMETRGLSFPDAIEFLAKRLGIPIDYEKGYQRQEPGFNEGRLYQLNSAANSFFRSSLRSAPAEVQQYIERRGLTNDLVDRFEIGFSPLGWQSVIDELKRSVGATEAELIQVGLARRSQRGELFDLLRGRLVFPVFTDRKRIAGFGGRLIPELQDSDRHKQESSYEPPKYLNTPETPIYKKSELLYGQPLALQSIRSSSRVFIVEGYLDVISLMSNGVENVVATCGTSLTDDHVKRLSRLCKRVTLLFDGDSAGIRAAARVFPLFINSGLDVFGSFLPEGDDPDSLARRVGDQLSSELDKLPGKSAFECFLEGLVIKAGAVSPGDLGPANKGVIAAEAASWIAKVASPFERDELTSQGSLYLRIDQDKLSKEVNVQISGELKKSESRGSPTGISRLELGSVGLSAQRGEIYAVDRLDTGDHGGKLPINAPKIDALDKLDRMILEIVMAGRIQFTTKILQDPEFVDGLNPLVFRFVSELHEILTEGSKLSVSGSGFGSEENTRAENTSRAESLTTSPETHSSFDPKFFVIQLLKQYGPSWLLLWRSSSKLKDDPEAHLEETFNQCVQMIKRRKVDQAMELLNSQMRSATDLTEKLQLGQKAVELSRERRLLSG